MSNQYNPRYDCNPNETDDDLVAEVFVCPNCFESRMDMLVWNSDGETVTCATCGAVYNPAVEGGF